MAVRTGGRPARTTYEVLARDGDDAALLECRLETGRTHQIRVHLAAIGHPVLGDAAYGSAGGPLRRLFLHAYVLAFTHPRHGDRRRFEAALPEELRRVLETRGIAPVGEDRPARAGDVGAG